MTASIPPKTGFRFQGQDVRGSGLLPPALPGICEYPRHSVREVRTSVRIFLQSPAEALLSVFFGGRAGEIRTRDLLNPIQALYQAEPRPVAEQKPSRRRGGDSRTKFESVLRAGGGVSSSLSDFSKPAA